MRALHEVLTDEMYGPVSNEEVWEVIQYCEYRQIDGKAPISLLYFFPKHGLIADFRSRSLEAEDLVLQMVGGQGHQEAHGQIHP